MSDTPNGPGWWQASDGRYYPPQGSTPGGPPGGVATDVDPTRPEADPTVPLAPGAPPRPGAPLPPPGPGGPARGRWKTWQLLVAMVVALLIGAGIGAAGASGDDDGEQVVTRDTTTTSERQTTTTPERQTSTTPAPTTTAPPAPASPESKGFVLESINIQKDFIDDFEATARIVDTQGGRGAGFTVTVFSGNQVVATLSGSANDMPADQAVTVDLISTDDYRDWDRYEFQTDYEF
jgi:hypothetical protein